MTTESRPIPPIALSALAMADQEHERTMVRLSLQTLSVMDLRPEDGWKLDVNTKCAIREAGDAGSAAGEEPNQEEQAKR